MSSGGVLGIFDSEEQFHLLSLNAALHTWMTDNDVYRMTGINPGSLSVSLICRDISPCLCIISRLFRFVLVALLKL